MCGGFPKRKVPIATSFAPLVSTAPGASLVRTTHFAPLANATPVAPLSESRTIASPSQGFTHNLLYHIFIFQFFLRSYITIWHVQGRFGQDVFVGARGLLRVAGVRGAVRLVGVVGLRGAVGLAERHGIDPSG